MANHTKPASTNACHPHLDRIDGQANGPRFNDSVILRVFLKQINSITLFFGSLQPLKRLHIRKKKIKERIPIAKTNEIFYFSYCIKYEAYQVVD